MEREGAGAAEARSRPPATGEARRRGGRGGGQGRAMGGPPEQGRATAGAAAEQGRRKNEQGFAGVHGLLLPLVLRRFCELNRGRRRGSS